MGSLRQVRLCIALVLMLSIGFSVINAQDSTFTEQEQAWIDEVRTAFDNMAELASVRITTQQVMTQTTAARESEVITKLEQSADAAINLGEVLTGTMSIEQSVEIQTNGDSVDNQSSTEIVLQDDVAYFRTDTLPNSSEWETREVDTFASLFYNVLSSQQYPLDSLATIQEAESDTLDGLNMRVFSLTLPLNDMPDSGIYQQINQMLPVTSTQPDLADQILSDVTVQVTIFIGEDDQLVYREDIQVEINKEIADLIPGSDITTQFQITLGRQVDYYSFNEPVEIDIIQPGS